MNGMNRRSLFKLLLGVASVPALTPIAKLFPEIEVESPDIIQDGNLTLFPNGPIDGWVSYNVRFTVGLPPSGIMRLKRIQIPEKVKNE